MEDRDIAIIRDIVADDEKTDAVLAVIVKAEERNKAKTHRRQADGIAAAKARGVRFGRPRMDYPKNFEQIYRQFKAKNITAIRASELLKINRNSFRELIRRYEEEQLWVGEEVNQKS